MKPSQMLHEARELLETGGHCKHTLTDGDGRHCAVGALLDVRRRVNSAAIAYGSGDPTMTRCQNLLAEALPSACLPAHGSVITIHDVVDFNNAAATSPEDVILLFKRAEEIAIEAGE